MYTSGEISPFNFFSMFITTYVPYNPYSEYLITINEDMHGSKQFRQNSHDWTVLSFGKIPIVLVNSFLRSPLFLALKGRDGGKVEWCYIRADKRKCEFLKFLETIVDNDISVTRNVQSILSTNKIRGLLKRMSFTGNIYTCIISQFLFNGFANRCITFPRQSIGSIMNHIMKRPAVRHRNSFPSNGTNFEWLRVAFQQYSV